MQNENQSLSGRTESEKETRGKRETEKEGKKRNEGEAAPAGHFPKPVLGLHSVLLLTIPL